VLHAERHGEGLNPTNLPLLSEHDTSAIRYHRCAGPGWGCDCSERCESAECVPSAGTLRIVSQI
jgi:hypothetical protein